MWFLYIMFALFAFVGIGTIAGVVRSYSSDNN